MLNIRAALVGCGAHAQMIIVPCIKLSPVTLIATCDIDLTRAKKLAYYSEAPLAFSNINDLLRVEEIEALFITTPISTHAEIAIMALEAGLHVFVEKPIASSPADAYRLSDVARKSNRYVMVGFNKRHAPCYLTAKATQDTLSFGKTLAVSVRYTCGNTYHDERSFAYNYCVHALDLLEFFGGPLSKPYWTKSVGADRRWVYSLVARGSEDVLLTAFLSTAESWGDPGETVDIIGEGHRIHCENLMRVVHYREAPACWERKPGLDQERDPLFWEPNMLVPDTMNGALHLQGYLAEVRHFAQSIILGMAPEPGVEVGIRAVELAESILMSEG